jgi:hypothetical protein
MIEREHALISTPAPADATPLAVVPAAAPRRGRAVWIFIVGFLAGAAALFGLALLASVRNF